MLKRVFIFLFLLVIATYMVVAMTAFNKRSNTIECKGLELVINDSIDYGFITKAEVLKLLNGKKMSPLGKTMNEINTRQIEDELRQHPLIENAECYRTPSNRIGIEITQRLPILRVMSSNGDNYFVDGKGVIMPLSGSTANVAIATGEIDRNFATKELYELGLFLHNDELWGAQIQQINVTPEKEIELIPLVGEHIIFLGKPGSYKEKFNKLEIFYKKVLNEVGWNKYNRISLEFDNQIICTKKN